MHLGIHTLVYFVFRARMHFVALHINLSSIHYCILNNEAPYMLSIVNKRYLPPHTSEIGFIFDTAPISFDWLSQIYFSYKLLTIQYFGVSCYFLQQTSVQLGSNLFCGQMKSLKNTSNLWIIYSCKAESVILWKNYREHFVYVPSQWETTLYWKVVYYWLGGERRLLLTGGGGGGGHTQNDPWIYINTWPLMAWLLVVVSHQQPWYWLCSTVKSLI